MVGVVGGVSIVGGVGIVGRLEYVRKFWTGVRGCGKVKICGKVKVCDKTGFVSNKRRWGGKRVAKREAAASSEEIDAEIGKFVKFLLCDAT